MQLVLIRPRIETLLVGIKELLPEHYRLTLVARSDKHPHAEIVFTEDDLFKVCDLLSEHGREIKNERSK
jgi:hypothetical protein